MFIARALRIGSVLCLAVGVSVLFPRNLSADDKDKKKDKRIVINVEELKKKIKPIKGDLNSFFTGDVPPLELTPGKFEAKWKKFFNWLEKGKKEGARFQPVNNIKKLTLFGLDVWEAVVRFKGGKFDRIDVSLYNRGDAESSVIVISGGTKKRGLSIADFNKRVKDIDGKITKWIQTEGKALPARTLAGDRHQLTSEKYWVKGEQCAGLTWSVTKVGKISRPEFIRFSFSRFDPKNDPRKMTTRIRNKGKLSNVKNLKDNVKTNKDGYTYIDNIPMVDQGPKGYCAVAAIERILKYYGSNVDQYQIAQAVDTTAGTDPVKMLKALKRATPRLGIRVVTYMDPPEFDGSLNRCVRDFLKELKAVNTKLKRAHMHQLPRMYPITASLRGNQTALDLYKEYKCVKKKTDFNKFKSNIKKNILQGIPVAWGLTLGIVPEGGKAPQMFGGHMRLIIGYNKDMSQLVFTDTWGAGHEFKTIDAGDAWIVTTFYGVFKPTANSQ